MNTLASQVLAWTGDLGNAWGFSCELELYTFRHVD
jgi:hypothetical protein